MKKIFTLFCLALLSLGALADDPVLFVKPWFAPKVDGYSWGGALESLYATDSKYLMTKVDGYDNLYKCSMKLNKEYDQVADAKGNTKTATDYYFNVVTTTTPGTLMSNAWNKNCGTDGSDALVQYPQAFTVPSDGTTVTFYALYDATAGKVRSWCDAGTIDVRNTGGALMDRHIPAAIGKTSSTCLFPLEEAAGQTKPKKVEIRIRLDWGTKGIDNHNYIWPNNTNSGSKYAVGSYTRAPMMKATFDATTFKIAVSQYWSDNEIPSYTLKVGDAGVATLVLPFNAPIPTGVSAYTLSYTSGSEAVAKEVTGTLSANTPVYIKAAAGDYTFTASAKQADNCSARHPQAGALVGNYSTYTVPDTKAYVLQKQNGEIAFYPVKDAKINIAPFRAYLVPQEATSPAKIGVRFDNTTGINNVSIRQLNSGALYNLAGQRVDASYKGVVISNGRKFIKK
jgi:hypothetical protein